MLKNRRYLIFVAFILVFAAGLFLRLRDFNADIAAWRSTREAHVASNIFYFVRDGISLAPEMFAKNMANKLFEFPLFSWISALVIKALGTPIAQTGRAINLVFWVARFWVSAAIVWQSAGKWRVALLAMLIVVLSPLDAFYSRALLADDLALLCAAVSVLGYLRWSRSTRPNTAAWLVMTGAGVLATFIKSPTYLPFAAGIGLAWLMALRPISFNRKLLPFAGFVVCIFASLVAFRALSNIINTGDPLHGAYWENAWYFGELADRLKPGLYAAIAKTDAQLVTNPLFFALALVGALAVILRGKIARHALWVGMLAGGAITIFVFFDLHAIHDYYHLPYVLPVAFFAALAINWALERAPKTWQKMALAAGAAVVLLAGFAKWDIPRTPPNLMIERGAFIRANTPPNAFVFYANTPEWSPDRLYFAQREGFNMGEKVSEWLEGGIWFDANNNPDFKRVMQEIGRPYARVYVFLTPQALKNDEAFYKRQNWQLVAGNSLGQLFLAQP